MVVPLLCSVFLLAMTHLSSGNYCICRDGLNDSVLQKNIDYACGAGADCTPILQNGACYNPNTVKDHCNFAVNSYYQRRSQAPGTCDFTATAIITQTVPNQSSGCVYPSSGGNDTSTPPPSTPGRGTPPPSSILTPPSSPFGVAPSGTGVFPGNNAATLAIPLHTTHLFYSLTLTLLLLYHFL
ncbi:hypothetical protein LguiA_032576 [Lonicera macranthoides]